MQVITILVTQALCNDDIGYHLAIEKQYTLYHVPILSSSYNNGHALTTCFPKNFNHSILNFLFEENNYKYKGCNISMLVMK